MNSKDVLGQTALHYAVRSYSHEIVEFLLKYKSSFPLEINSENQFGQTAFYYAAHLLHCLAFPGNIDNLDFLPLHVVRTSPHHLEKLSGLIRLMGSNSRLLPHLQEGV